MSDGSEDQDIAQAGPEEAKAAVPQSNFERLITHLAEDSLAAKLVEAYAGAGSADRAAAVKAVADDRLTELKRSHDEAES